jgi:hypothetical protein
MIIFGLDIPAIYLIVGFEFLGAVAFMIGWFIYNKDKFQALLCEKFLNTYRIKKKIKISLTRTEFKWKNFNYQIDFKHAIIDDKNKPILYYLYEGALPIKPIEGIETHIDAQTFKVLSDGKVMQHIGDRKMTKTYMYIIVAAVIMIGVVGIVGLVLMNQSNNNIIQLSKQFLNVTKSYLANNQPIVVGK